ncbi:hypothetical protein CE91St41_20410 [Oscillospiraceae bacterium]|nr:hypothetical protein CE91St40_17110 [Oscillospiraceae bacterium]BDF75152.1 hypothetical protein CE91St41_20410 [Oscillospiraceae bacterium]
MEEIREVKPSKPNKSKPPKRPNLFLRFLAFLLTLALMVGAVAAVAYRDKFNIDALRRYFTYRSLELNDSGQAESFEYEGGSGATFAPLDGGLLVCSASSIRLYSSGGTEYVGKTVSLENPVVSYAGKHALVYDAGGTDLYVYAGKEEVFSLTLGAGSSLLSASVNPSGWLAVVAQESGYKGTVTVYNASYTPVMKIGLSSSFITDAAVSPDNKSVAVVTAGLGEGSFESRVNFYQLNHDEDDPTPDATASIGNNICLNLRWAGDGIWSVGENGVSRVDQGEASSFDYTGRYLKNFSLDGDGYAVVLLGKYRAGSSAELVVVDGDGNAAATLSTNSQVLSLSAAGRYIAVLTADRLDIYTKDLELYDSLDATQGARRVIQRSDGTALLIGTDTARLYLPGLNP